MKTFKRDERIADEANKEAAEYRALMCQAQGCQNRWSVDFGNGRWCTWHDRKPKENRGKPMPDHIRALMESAIKRFP